MADSGPGTPPESIPGAGAPPPAGPLTAALASRSIIAPGIADIVLSMRTPPSLRFRAGQFVSIAVGVGETAGTTSRRSYSIASPSDQGDRLRFIIRVIREGAASDYLMALPVGAEIRMTGPHGFFMLDPQHAGDIVFGATGTGVSAVMPMLSQLALTPPLGRRLLYWGVRNQEDFFAATEVADLCRAASCEQRLFLTNAPPGWTGDRGRITPVILSEFPELTAPTFYLVGNGAMISELKRELLARGVNRKKQIRTEAFFD